MQHLLINFAILNLDSINCLDLRRKYSIIIEEEASLEKKFYKKARLSFIILFGLGFLFCSLGIVIILFVATPLKTLLPGYLKKSERAATEEQHQRLDSLLRVYEINEAYLSGIWNAINPTLTDTIKAPEKSSSSSLTTDSLLPLSNEERNFVEYIRERDKFNIAVTSIADASTMIFNNLNPSAVISEATRNSYIAEFLLPWEGSIYAIAEGKVISIASSPKASGSYEILIQHPNGFLSKISRLDNLMVTPGERVTSGQIIGSSSRDAGIRSNIVNLELWHDGNPLVPSQYISGSLNNKNKE